MIAVPNDEPNVSPVVIIPDALFWPSAGTSNNATSDAKAIIKPRPVPSKNCPGIKSSMFTFNLN